MDISHFKFSLVDSNVVCTLLSSLDVHKTTGCDKPLSNLFNLIHDKTDAIHNSLTSATTRKTELKLVYSCSSWSHHHLWGFQSVTAVIKCDEKVNVHPAFVTVCAKGVYTRAFHHDWQASSSIAFRFVDC